jgi:hypothetical protein
MRSLSERGGAVVNTDESGSALNGMGEEQVAFSSQPSARPERAPLRSESDPRSEAVSPYAASESAGVGVAARFVDRGPRAACPRSTGSGKR